DLRRADGPAQPVHLRHLWRKPVAGVPRKRPHNRAVPAAARLSHRRDATGPAASSRPAVQRDRRAFPGAAAPLRGEAAAAPRRRGTAGWYQECVRGPLEIEGFRLEEKVSERPAGRALVWEMDPFSARWNEHAVGILHVQVDEAFRRQGLARLLLGNVLRYYHDQYFTLVESQPREQDTACVALLRGLGFHQVDVGHL